MYMGHLKKPLKGSGQETARNEWPGFIVGCIHVCIYLHVDSDNRRFVVSHVLKWKSTKCVVTIQVLDIERGEFVGYSCCFLKVT